MVLLVWDGFNGMGSVWWYGKVLPVWGAFGGMEGFEWYGRVLVVWEGFGGGKNLLVGEALSCAGLNPSADPRRGHHRRGAKTYWEHDMANQ